MFRNNLNPQPQTIEFLDYFNETFEYSQHQQERDKSGVYSNDGTHQHPIPIESFKHETEKNEFYDICNQIKHQHFDVLLMFHEIDLNQGENKNMIHYIILKTKELSSSRFAIGFYFKNRLSVSNMFDFNYFKLFSNEHRLFLVNFNTATLKYFTDTLIENNENIKAKILNLDWKSSNHKIVINLGYDSNLLSNFSFENDIYTSSFRTKKINFFNIKLDSNHIDVDLVDELLSTILIQKVNVVKHVSFLKELFLLKRHNFESFKEYKVKINNGINFKFQFKYNIMFIMHLETYGLSDTSGTTYIKKSGNCEKIYVKFDEKPKEVTNSIFIASAEYNENNFNDSARLVQNRKIWLEKIDNFETFQRMMYIHLTAKRFLDKFKKEFKLKVQSLTDIEISEVKLGKIEDSFFFVSFINEHLNKSNISMPNQETKDILESLAHFTYDLTKGEMVVLDLRPINVTQYRILITEPVIFSIMPDRFVCSDLGAKGIECFIREHTCNSICTKLNLPKFPSGVIF